MIQTAMHPEEEGFAGGVDDYPIEWWNTSTWTMALIEEYRPNWLRWSECHDPARDYLCPYTFKLPVFRWTDQTTYALESFKRFITRMRSQLKVYYRFGYGLDGDVTSYVTTYLFIDPDSASTDQCIYASATYPGLDGHDVYEEDGPCDSNPWF